MNFNPHILNITTSEQSREELAKIGCDSIGINIMSAKALFTIVKLENVPSKAANLLKQTFLGKGGEVAVARGTADLTVESTDVLIFATSKQYQLALAQLKMQPWGLPKLAAAIERTVQAANSFPRREYQWSDRKLCISQGRTLIMGILNITPDSFSDGGQFTNIDEALRHTERLIAEGADIIDIGAESTRPYGGNVKISASEEMERLLPVLEKVLAISPIPVSVDTYKAVVAEAAIKQGAHIINDIWGLQYDPDMAKMLAKYDIPIVIMHNQEGSEYQRDMMAEVCTFLRRSVKIATDAGIDCNNLIIDPGIGFGKRTVQNLAVLSRLHELKSLGCPLLLGTSRKRFIGDTLGGLPTGQRLEGTAATVACGILHGANIVRVHDVKAMVRVAQMTDGIIGVRRNE